MSRLILNLLGGFEAATDGSEPVALPSRKGRALLTWLAMNRERHVSRDTAIGLLWGDSPQKQAAASLNQTIYELRQSFRRCGLEVLRTDKETMELLKDEMEVDARDLLRLARSSDMADIAEAARLYRGDLLAGFAAPTPEYEEWVEAERRRLRAVAIQTLTTLVSWRADHDESTDLVAVARRLAELDPYSEPAHCALMTHFALKGQIGLSIDCYETLRKRLHEDLNTTPSDQMERLRDQILKRELGSKGGVEQTSAVPTAQPSQSARRTRLNWGVGALLTVIVVLAVSTSIVWSSRPDKSLIDPSTKTTPLPAKPSIAVLAFDDLSTGADRDYLSDAISEGIITELSKFTGLFVIARNSSFHYRDTPTNVREIARDLGVRYILEGSQQKASDRLRVTIQLIDAIRGDHLWTETYDRDLVDIFQIQDEIVSSVASTLGEKLRKIAGEEVKRVSPTAMRAYEHVLRGMRYFREFTREGTEHARLAYLDALEADPTLTQAHAGLVWVYVNGYRWGWTDLDRQTALKLALKHAQVAVHLASDDYLPHMAMGYALMQVGQLDRAIVELEKSVRLNPNAGNAMANLAEALGYVGRLEEAAQLLRRAMRLDPYHPDYFFWDLAWIEWQMGKCEDGLSTMRKMSDMPYLANRTVAAIYVCLGQVDDARAAIVELLNNDPNYSIGEVRQTFHEKIEDPAVLHRWLDDLRVAGLPD
jgi:TolB-like protein/DNA-binding SARP family transcriptional activator